MKNGEHVSTRRHGLGVDHDVLHLAGSERGEHNLAGNLLDVGPQPGDRVASLMPNCTALIIHYIACMKAGLAGVQLKDRRVPQWHLLGVAVRRAVA
jgi:hypothetical protein